MGRHRRCLALNGVAVALNGVGAEWGRSLTLDKVETSGTFQRLCGVTSFEREWRNCAAQIIAWAQGHSPVLDDLQPQHVLACPVLLPYEAGGWLVAADFQAGVAACLADDGCEPLVVEIIGSPVY